PDAQILMILRNPADAAFSLWRMNRNVLKAREQLSFPEALEAETTRRGDPRFRKGCRGWWHGNYYYFDRGCYYHQVKRYLEIFGPKQVLSLLFDDLKREPLKTCREVFTFLRVDPGFVPTLGVHNPNLESRSRILHYFLNRWGRKKDS